MLHLWRGTPYTNTNPAEVQDLRNQLKIESRNPDGLVVVCNLGARKWIGSV
jgi:hypothetical protein